MFSSTYTYENCRSPSRPEVQYQGLHNQGSTCYLNSVLQVLFRTEDFREAVERHCHGNAVDENCLDCRLQSLFKELKWRTARTNSITKCLGIDRVNVQRDAAEYFEKILSLTSSDVSQVFRGLLTDRTICSSCGTEMDSDGPFWHLPLALVDSDSELYSVVEGTEDYFRESRLTGENQVYCDSCDAKSDATTKCVIKNHPEVLMLLLKRFTFDYMYMQYIKINSIVDVPDTLHIPENQTYELYAVVDHFGGLRGGHYSATINVDGEWYKFNDTSVTVTQQVEPVSSSAYLLFYKKTKVHTADNGTHNICEVSTTGKFPAPKTGICETDEEDDPSAETETMTKDKSGFNDRFSPEVCRNVDYQHTDPEHREEWYDCINYPEAEKQKDKRKIRVDEEDVRGKSEADNQAEKRETLLAEAQLQEPDHAQETDCGRRDDVKQAYILQKQQRRRVMGVNRDQEGKTEVSREMTPDISNMLQDAQRFREQRRSSGHSEHKESSTAADGKETSSGKERRLTKYDLCFLKPGAVGNIIDNTMTNHQTCRQRPCSMYERCLEKKEKKKDVQEGSEQSRGHNKRSQSKHRSERQHCYGGHMSNQSDGGSDDAREKKSEQRISATHKKHEGVDEEIKTEGRRAKSPLKRSETAGSRRQTENPGDDRAENSSQVESQTEASPDINGDSKDRRHGSKWRERFLLPRKLRLKSKKTSRVSPAMATTMFVGKKGKKVSNVSFSKKFRKFKLSKGWKIPSADKNKVDSSGLPLKMQNDRKRGSNQNTKTTGCLSWQSQKNEDQVFESYSFKDDSNV